MVQLWPEASADNARNLLNAAVHAVRRAMGEEVLVSQGANVQLDRSRVTIDVAEFEDAVARGEHGRAVELYAGPFLDGLSLPGAVEFEHWLDGERDRLERLYHSALEAQADAVARRDGPANAVSLWRRRLACSPLDARVVVRLMETLEASGDRAGALQVAMVHESLLRAELDAPPDPDVDSLAARLRATPTRRDVARPVQLDGQAAAQHGVIEVDLHLPGADASSNGADAAEQQDLAQRTVDVPPRRRLKQTVLIAVVASLLLSVWLVIQGVRRDSRLEPVTPAPTTSVAVFPFEVRGGEDLEWMGEATMDLLSQALDGVGDLRRIDPRAIMSRKRRDGVSEVSIEYARRITREIGGARFTLGTVTRLGDEIHLAVDVYNPDRNEAVSESFVAAGLPNELPDLVIDLARQLLPNLPLGTGARLENIRAVNTSSYEALKAYAHGEALLRQSDFVSAAEKLSASVRLDSTFALAWSRLSHVQGWAPGDRIASVHQAMRFADRLSHRDRLHVRATHAFLTGAADTAETLTTAITDQYRNDVEAWANLAAVDLFYGWRGGKTLIRAREALERVVALDPYNYEARYHAIWLAMVERRYADAEALLPHEPPDAGAGRFVIFAQAVIAYAQGDSTARAWVNERLESSSAEVSWNTGASLATFTDSLDAARRLWQRLASDDTRQEPSRAAAQGFLAALAVSRGRFHESMVEFDRFAAMRPLQGHVYSVWLRTAPPFETPPAELRMLRDALENWVVPPLRPEDMIWPSLNVPVSLHPWIKDYLIGVLSARLGDNKDALWRAELLEAATDPPDPEGLRPDLAREIRALVAFESQQFSDALKLLEESSYGLTNYRQTFSAGFYRRPMGRLLRAATLEKLGRYDVALGWYAGFFVSELAIDWVFLGPVHLRIAGIYERTDNRDLAARHYRCFLARWQGADPEYAPLLSDATSRLAELDPTSRHVC